MPSFITNSEQETFELAKTFASRLCGGEIILLFGDLGAGKTVFAKGIAAGLGIKKIVTSPTFVLMNQYQISGRMSEGGDREDRKGKKQMKDDCIHKGRKCDDKGVNNQTKKTNASKVNCQRTNVPKYLLHVDTYRLKQTQDLIDIGVMDYMERRDVITVIEWPKKIKTLMRNIPKSNISTINFAVNDQQNIRHIDIS